VAVRRGKTCRSDIPHTRRAIVASSAGLPIAVCAGECLPARSEAGGRRLIGYRAEVFAFAVGAVGEALQQAAALQEGFGFWLGICLRNSTGS